MARKSVLVLAVATAILMPPHAAAGGWWTSIRLDRATVLAGQRVNAHANVMFSSVDAVEAAESGGKGEEFFVYLLRGFDDSIVERAMRRRSPPNWWSIGGADAFRVGRVVIGGSASNLALANASFRVPNVPLGKYAVMFCDAGCAHPLADVVPMTEFAVVANPLIARLAVRVDRLEQQAHTQGQALLGTRAAAQEAERAAARRLARAHARIETLERRLAGSRRPMWAGAGWLLAGVVVGVVAGILWRRRRQPGPRARIADWHPSDDELRELLAVADRDRAAS
jgi:hypothetical protein